MRVEARRHQWGFAATALALLLGAGTAQAGIKYLGDGAVQNSRGGWDLPKQGSCPADLTAKTRPDCIARRFTAATSAASWRCGSCPSTSS